MDNGQNTTRNRNCKETKDGQPVDVLSENPHWPELYVVKFMTLKKMSLRCFPAVILVQNIDGVSMHYLT